MSNNTILTQSDLLEKVGPAMRANGQPFRKAQNVLARPARTGELIQTVTADGLETSNEAEAGDFIIKNQTEAGEQYIVSSEQFEKKYRPIQEAKAEGWVEYRPLGRIIALELTPDQLEALGLPAEFRFDTTWEEEMVAKAGDYLACPPDYSEVYRIARKEFFETYAAE